jgi:intracellular septation protein
MKTILEFLPLAAFFIFYALVDIYWATGSIIVATALQIAYFPLIKEKVPKKNWVIFGIIAVFGGLTLIFHDDTFIKWKVTIINMIFAIALIVSDYVFKNNLMKKSLGESMELPEKIWTNLNLSWAAFFVVCAGLNHYIAFNLSQETWVNFKVFGLTGLTLVFGALTVFFTLKHIKEDDEVPKKATK